MARECTQDEIKELEEAIQAMDRLSQGGFSEISAIAKLCLMSLESPRGYLHMEILATAFQAISDKAYEAQAMINCEAERTGCNYTDPAYMRRFRAVAQANRLGADHGE